MWFSLVGENNFGVNISDLIVVLYIFLVGDYIYKSNLLIYLKVEVGGDRNILGLLKAVGQSLI